MSNHTFPKVQAGAPLSAILGAGYHNALRDGLKWIDAQRNGVGAGAAKPSSDDPCTVWIQNSSGADREAFDILGIGDTLPITPDDNLGSFQRDCAVQGVIPAFPEHDARFAILLEPIPDGRPGTGQVLGVCPARVQVTDGLEWYGYADLTHADPTQLTLLPSGKAQILWLADEPIEGTEGGEGTETRWALVLLGTPPGNVSARVTLDDILLAAGTVTASFLAGKPLTDTTNDAEICDGDEGWSLMSSGGSLPKGTNAVVKWYPDSRTWQIENAACSTS